MDTLFGIALVGLWIVISVMALSRAFSSVRTPGNSRASQVSKSKTGVWTFPKRANLRLNTELRGLGGSKWRLRRRTLPIAGGP
jgi:hypothetical protein